MVKCDFLEGRLPKYFFQEICSSGGKQTMHKVSTAFIVKNCHPRASLKPATTLQKEIFQNLTSNVTMTSLLETMGKS